MIFPIKLCPKSSHFQAHPQIKMFSYHIPMKSMFLSLWFLVTFMKPISESSGLSSFDHFWRIPIPGIPHFQTHLDHRNIVFPMIPPWNIHEILSYPHVCCFHPHRIPRREILGWPWIQRQAFSSTATARFNAITVPHGCTGWSVGSHGSQMSHGHLVRFT